MNDIQGASKAHRGDLSGRRWTANATAAVLALVAAFAIEGGELWQPMPPAVARRVQRVLNKVCFATAATTLRLTGWKCSYDALSITYGPFKSEVRGLVGPVAAVPKLARMLLLGAVLAGATWGLGWGRRLLLAGTAVLLPLGLLPILTGLVLGVLMAVYGGRVAPLSPRSFPGHEAVALLTVLAVAGLWWIIKAADKDRPDHPPLPDELRVPGPLCWVALAQAPLLGFLVPAAVGAQSKADVLFRMVGTVVAPVYAWLWGGLFLLGLLRKSPALRWAWLGLLPLLVLGPVRWLAWATLLVLLATGDERTAGLLGRPLGPSARERVRRRRLRPLTPLAWLCILLAAGGALSRLLAPLAQRFPTSWLETHWAIGGFALLGGGLALWESIALRRGGYKHLALPAQLGAAAAAVTAMAGAGFAAWGG